MTLKKAITDLKLSAANRGKLRALEPLALEYQRVVQAYIDWLIEHEVRQPNKYANLPVADLPLRPLATLRLATSLRHCPVLVQQ
jgi:hypothetical protein